MSNNILWNFQDSKLYVYQFGKLYTNTGVWVNEKTGEAFLIDSPYGAYQYLTKNILQGIKVVAVLVTHSHWDHIGDDHLFQKIGAKIYVHPEGRKIVETPEIIIPYTKCSFGLTPCPVYKELSDEEHISVSGVDILVRWVPGHTVSGVYFYIKEARVVFCGDTLFKDSIGRYDFIDGNKDQLIYNIRRKILTLPEDTVVIPGHGEFTTVKYEAEHNPFVKI